MMNSRVTRWVAVALVMIAAPAFAQSPGQSFDSAGIPIHYLDQGRGTPVVLLHGLTGAAARHWEAPGVMQALASAGYRAIAMDCRGHGQSGKPIESGQYGMEMVRDVVRLLDHLKIERAHIVGYSMGGAIASQFVVQNPARVLTVTLLGFGWNGEGLTELRSQMTALADGFARRDASWLIRGVTAGGEKGPTDEDVAALNASLFARNDPQALAAATRGMIPLFELSADSLRAIKVPALAIIGEHDPNLTAVERMKTVVPGLEMVKIPGATHQSSVRPSAAPLVAFLNKHRRD